MSTLADQCRRRRRYSMATNEDYINRCAHAEGKAHFDRRTIAQCCAILTIWTLHIVQYSVRRQNQSEHVCGSLILFVSVSCRSNDHWWIDLVFFFRKAAYKYNLITSSSYAYSREVRARAHCSLSETGMRWAMRMQVCVLNNNTEHTCERERESKGKKKTCSTRNRTIAKCWSARIETMSVHREAEQTEVTSIRGNW